MKEIGVSLWFTHQLTTYLNLNFYFMFLKQNNHLKQD